MNNLIRAEFYKLKRDKMFWVLFLVMALWGVLHAVFITLSSKGMLFLDINGGFMVGGPEEGPKYSETGMATFLITLRAASNPFFLSLLLGMFAGFFISNEYKTGVIKNVISCGRRRSEIFISKGLVYFIGVIVIWLIFPLIAAGSAMIANGFNIASDGITFMLMIRVVGLSLVQLAAFSALVVFIGTMVEESGKAIILSITIITGLSLFFIILGNSFAMIQTVYEYTILYQMIGVVFNPALTTTEIIRCLCIGLVTIILLVYGGIGTFGRKEMK
jgi:ABC-2 type transport system permease protein